MSLDADAQLAVLLEMKRARDGYRKLVDELMAKVAKLERGLIGPTKQRFKGDDGAQLSLAVLGQLLGLKDPEGADASELADKLVGQAEAEAASSGDDGDSGDDDADEELHRRKRKATGRKAARADLAKVRIEMLPDEVKRLGTDAFERIGEETATTIERRTSALVEVTVVRPKFRAKTDEAIEAVRNERASCDSSELEPEAWITTAPPPELPIERGMAGPGLLANVIVRRFDDHLPYNRLENVYEREGMRLSRSTLYGWMDALRELFTPLVDAMRADARASPYVCTDATGVLVQAPEQCSRGHFWVLVAPGRHVIFAFSHDHNGAAVDKLLGDYGGYVVADAHSVYDHLFGDDGASEVACWGHARAYFFKALRDRARDRARRARQPADHVPARAQVRRQAAQAARAHARQQSPARSSTTTSRSAGSTRRPRSRARPWPPRSATRSTRKIALRRFLDDGRLPATNNISERQLRRQATGRNNWLFIGSDDGAEVNVLCATLVASCHMHGIEPETYLRDLLCLLPGWPAARVLELAPCHWKQTREQPDTQQRLADNVFRNAIIGLDSVHSPAS